MVESEVVEIDGVFVGTAILLPNRVDLTFFAIHHRLRPMHGNILPSLAVLRHQAAHHFRGVSTVAEAVAGSRRVRI